MRTELEYTCTFNEAERRYLLSKIQSDKGTAGLQKLTTIFDIERKLKQAQKPEVSESLEFRTQLLYKELGSHGWIPMLPEKRDKMIGILREHLSGK